MVSPFPKGHVTLNMLQNLGLAMGLLMEDSLGNIGPIPNMAQGKGFIHPHQVINGLYHYIPVGIFIFLYTFLKPVRWGTLVPYTLLGGCLIKSMPHMFGRKTRHFIYTHNYNKFDLKKLSFA